MVLSRGEIGELCNSKVGKKIMSDVRSLGRGASWNRWSRSYKIKFDKEDPYNPKGWEIIGRSHPYNSGFIRWNGKFPDNHFGITLKGDCFMSYRKLAERLEYALDCELDSRDEARRFEEYLENL